MAINLTAATDTLTQRTRNRYKSMQRDRQIKEKGVVSQMVVFVDKPPTHTPTHTKGRRRTRMIPTKKRKKNTKTVKRHENN